MRSTISTCHCRVIDGDVTCDKRLVEAVVGVLDGAVTCNAPSQQGVAKQINNAMQKLHICDFCGVYVEWIYMNSNMIDD